MLSREREQAVAEVFHEPANERLKRSAIEFCAGKQLARGPSGRVNAGKEQRGGHRGTMVGPEAPSSQGRPKIGAAKPGS